MTLPRKVNLEEQLGQIDDYFQHRIIADINEFEAKLVKVKGDFIWHHHDDEDELFLILKGRLRMQFRAGEVVLGPGELIAVPHPLEHRPVADEEVHLLLIERSGTRNTGNVVNERTTTAVRA